MSEGQRSTLLAYLRRLGGTAVMEGNDAELLQRFAVQREETAFAALLRRHGPLVWSVCRRVLAEEHAAEDAFQATFLVLVRKAHSVSKQASIRSWLYGVALRVALRARQQENLRRRREQELARRSSSGEATWEDVRPILDEEIQRLPEKYRLPILLCYLEGQTNDEAAKVLRCPRGTIATRLARARERLRSQLLRRGVTLSATALTALLSDNVLSAALPPLLVGQTARIVVFGAASTSITMLTEGVLHAMFLSKLKTTLAAALILAALGGAGVGAYYLGAQAPAPKTEEPLKKPQEAVPDKKAADKPEERLQKLLKERQKIAEMERTLRYDLYRVGANEPGTGHPVTLHLAVDAAKHLLKAELELSKTKADRLEAREKYFSVIKEIVKISEAQYKAGGIVKAALVSAQYEQLDAEIELEREKAR